MERVLLAVADSTWDVFFLRGTLLVGYCGCYENGVNPDAMLRTGLRSGLLNQVSLEEHLATCLAKL